VVAKKAGREFASSKAFLIEVGKMLICDAGTYTPRL
jgi:hypothetical protein